MKKKSINLLAALLTGASLLLQSQAALAAEPAIKVELDGQVLSLTHDPVVWQDRTYVPFRDIFEKLGATVEWNPDNMTVTATKDDVTVVLSLTSKSMWRNGVPIDMGNEPILFDDRFMVPVRFIAEAMNNPVTWDEATKTVRIGKSNREKINQLLGFDWQIGASWRSKATHTVYGEAAGTVKKAQQVDDFVHVKRSEGNYDLHGTVTRTGDVDDSANSYETYVKDGQVYVAYNGYNVWTTSPLNQVPLFQNMGVTGSFNQYAKDATLDEDSQYDVIDLHVKSKQVFGSLDPVLDSLPVTVIFEFDKATHLPHRYVAELDFNEKGVKFQYKREVEWSEINSVPPIQLPPEVLRADAGDLSHLE